MVVTGTGVMLEDAAVDTIKRSDSSLSCKLAWAGAMVIDDKFVRREAKSTRSMISRVSVPALWAEEVTGPS